MKPHRLGGLPNPIPRPNAWRRRAIGRLTRDVCSFCSGQTGCGLARGGACMLNSKRQFNHGFLTDISLDGKRLGKLPINRLFFQFNLP